MVGGRHQPATHTRQQQARVTNSTVAQIPHQVVLSRLVDPGVRVWFLAGGLDGVVDNDRIGGLAGLDGDLIATDSIVRDQIPGARIKDSVNAISRARGDLIVVDEGRSGPKEGDAIGVILQDVGGDHISARACLDKDALVSVGDVVVGQRGLAYKLYHGQIPIGVCKTLA